MDILVFPYRNIYQSGALMLAYTLSKAVMVSPAEGFREDVIHGKNGFITDFNNGEEFRNIILYLISNKEKLKDIGNYNRMRADTKHGWDGIAVETEKTYKRVMS